MVCCENQRILLFVHQDATGGSFSHGSGHSAGDRTAEDAGRASDKAGHTADDGNTYIVPMISGQDDYEAVYEVLKFDKRKSFVYDKDGYSSLIRYETYVIDDESVHYFAFLDTTRQSAECQTYIKKMSAGEKGYTQEGLLKSEKDFGLFLLETNDLNKTAQEVFCDYKSRWEIETFYNYIDNTMDFNALYQNDYCCTQGLGFIVQIAGMIFHDVQKAISEKGLSVKDTLYLIKGLKLSKERDRYTVRNENKTRRELCEKFSLNPSNHGVISSPT